MYMSGIRILPLVLAVCLAAGPQAWAQTAPVVQGELNAVAYHEVPGELALEVTLYDDSDLNLQVRARMEEALRAAGYTIAEDAPFELSLETASRLGEAPDWGPSLGELSSSGGGVDIQLNIWSNTQDSVIGGRQDRPSTVGQLHLQVRAVLSERGGGALWEGRAVSQSRGSDSERLANGMVMPLAESLGQTVREHTFPIP
jgi:hypothetical protein